MFLIAFLIALTLNVLGSRGFNRIGHFETFKVSDNEIVAVIGQPIKISHCNVVVSDPTNSDNVGRSTGIKGSEKH